MGERLDPDSLRDFAAELAEASGRAIAGMFRHPDLAVESKEDDSPVTVADRYAEALLRERILDRFPDHGIVGEEFGTKDEDAEYVWVLDPIDGTISFVAGVPLFGTLIGLLHEGEPVLGVIHQPITRELAIGTASGTTVNGEVVRVREDRSLAEAMLLTTDPGAVGEHRDLAGFETLWSRAARYRGWGDCYGYLMVASGRADIMLDPIMHPWDIAALVPVVRGAGGVITTWEGADPIGGASTVAAAPGLHREVMEILNGTGAR
ncbi:histidinol-phosphatase [Candidatus Palauibacter sp.]|uniref:histidinol-phosphatase n=1 Tax=Candidatus Palauibacter sp. TaxID=3101350 RepID=UPI003AF24F91